MDYDINNTVSIILYSDECISCGQKAKLYCENVKLHVAKCAMICGIDILLGKIIHLQYVISPNDNISIV